MVMMAKLRHAMQLSNASTQNITAAHEACQYWAGSIHVLEQERGAAAAAALDANVMGLCYALYASCLVRIGQDAQAVQVLDKALLLLKNLDQRPSENNRNTQDLRVAKAQALQRLLKYEDARQEYQKLLLLVEEEEPSSPSPSLVGAIGAATCSLRLGDLPTAVEALNSARRRARAEDDISPALQGLLGVVQYFQTGDAVSHEYVAEGIRLAAADEFLYRWIQAALLFSENDDDDDDDKVVELVVTSQPSFLSLIQINLCPLDDPSLILLDDKVHLHQVLSRYPQHTSKFWPRGMIVVPASSSHDNHDFDNDIIDLDDSEKGKNILYILKERSGYGSHGNRILSASEASSLSSSSSSSWSQDEELLLQQMVDPPLFLNGRKFSLRIYVIYFSPDEAYLSPDGLVKLASARMDTEVSSSSSIEGNMDPRLHMTNSGRDVAMEQHNLHYLQEFLEEKGESYNAFWNRTQTAIEEVLRCYEKERKGLHKQWDGRRERLRIPKIMGFDFVVDSNLQPWLVEVNRFPGLEPRDESDRGVKHQVVHDAWLCAGARLISDKNMKNNPFQSLLQSLGTSSSSSDQGHRLQRLNSQHTLE